jgi:hypothetical protein
MIDACATIGKNTGDSACPVKMGKPRRAFFTSGRELTANDLLDSDAVKDWMEQGILQEISSTDKLFLSPHFNDAEDATGDPNFGALADGFEDLLDEALNKMVLIHASNYCQQVGMSSLNGFKGKVFILDDANVFWYVTKTNGGGKGLSVGLLYTPKPKFKGNAVNAVRTRIGFASLDEFMQMGAIKLDFVPTILPQLSDVVLDDRETGENSNGTASNNVFTIGGKTSCDGVDVYASLADAMEDTDLWVITDVATGEEVTIDSVAKNDSAKGWDITANVTEFNSLSSGTRFKIGWRKPETLVAAGVEGVEAKAIKFKKA